jgi:hypothetical protein
MNGPLDGLKLDDPVAAFFDFCKERENIRLKRAKGRIFLWNWLIYLTQIVGDETSWDNNSFMGSFLEFIVSNSPIYFLQILFILFFAQFFWGAF